MPLHKLLVHHERFLVSYKQLPSKSYASTYTPYNIRHTLSQCVKITHVRAL